VLPATDAVVLLLRWRASDAEMWKPFAQHVPLTSTPCHLGDTPMVPVRGRYRKWAVLQPMRRKIVFRGHVFGCRRCCGLWNESQSENPIDRSIRRARKIRMRLGDGRSLVEPLPERPSRKNLSADLQPAEPGEPRQELISVSGTDGGAESPSTCGRFDGTGGFRVPLWGWVSIYS
jgi:hypothetical protein